MTIRRGFCVSVAMLLVCGVAATGQQASTPTQQVVSGAQPASRAIQLDVVVTPKSGKPVSGLHEHDFVVLDNKVPQTITSFHAYDGSQQPVEVILLIDSVNTSFRHVAYERTEIDKFLSANGGKLSQPMTLAILTDDGVRKQPGYTKDGNAIAAELDKETIGLREITRETGFYGAGERADISVKALRQLLAYEATRPGRKVILWVSPGWPLLPGTQGFLTGGQETQIFEEIVSISGLLRQAQTTVYDINPLGPGEGVEDTFEYLGFMKGIQKPYDSNLGNLALQVLATQSGGLVLTGSSDIAGMLARCMAEAGAYYTLSFDPPAARGKDDYHKVEVQTGEHGLTARTRTGYYAQP